MRIPDLSDVPELSPVPADEEYDLRIIKAQDVTSDNTGRSGIMLIAEIKDVENAENIFHRIWLPMEGDDEAKQMVMWRMIKEFMTALGLDPSGAETEDFQGLEFSAIIGVEDDNNGRPRNFIKRVT